MMLFSKGDHIVLTDDVYGGTYRVITKVLNRFGITATFVDSSDISKVEEAIEENTKAIFLRIPNESTVKNNGH